MDIDNSPLGLLSRTVHTYMIIETVTLLTSIWRKWTMVISKVKSEPRKWIILTRYLINVLV